MLMFEDMVHRCHWFKPNFIPLEKVFETETPQSKSKYE